MLNFCKRNLSLHSFLSSEDHHHHHRILHRRFCSMDTGLSLIVNGSGERPENILESVSVKPRMKRGNNYYGYCFLDEISGCGGNGFNGLKSCTESLGFESSDQMEEEVEEDEKVLMMRSRNLELRRWRRSVDRNRKRDELMEEKKKKKVFPPPLSSMNPNGQPKFFLKPVRKDGRLELIEVGINRPDSILRACRQDGRLTLHFVAPPIKQEQVIQEEQEEEVEEQEEEVQEEEEKKIQEKESWNVSEFIFPLTSSSGSTGEGFRRCHELNNHHHHHHHLNMWNQHHQVTTRSTVHVL